MLVLTGKFLQHSGIKPATERLLYKVTTNTAVPRSAAKTMAYLSRDGQFPDGYGLYLAFEDVRQTLGDGRHDRATAILPDSARFLDDGDIIRIATRDGSYRVVFRNATHHQSILVTERCNHYCLMCSQPPRDIQDDYLLDEIERLLHLIPRTAREIGFTGGEPTLCGERLIRLLRLSDKLLPQTAVHLLSNGRRFAEAAFAKSYADIKHHDLMVGIPLYSDDPARHNYVVQAEGAFDETIAGILNLKRLKQRVEIRVVLHAQTIERLQQLATFIARNLLFVDQVALMGLEITGFTRGNLGKLWIDPYDYRFVLEEAVNVLNSYKIRTHVYNHQLCVVTEKVRRHCRRSISDWKNEYLSVCDSCELRAKCGGFFSSAVAYRHSDHISPQAANVVAMSS